MPPQLKEDLRLLDILDSLPTQLEKPTTDDLSRRLTDLCMEQAVVTTPEKVTQAVSVYQQRQADEAQLLDILTHLPQADQQTASLDDLQQRLAALCAERKVEATPESVQRAVAAFKGNQGRFALWSRPQTEAERLAGLAALTRVKKRCANWGFGMFSVSAVVIVLATFTLLGAGLLDSDKYAGLIKGMFITIGFTFFVGAFIGLGGSIALDPDNCSAPWAYRKWFGTNPYATWPAKWLTLLNPAQPNVAQMQAWMSNPEAQAALKLLSKTPVPITQRDAQHLDAIVRRCQSDMAAAEQKKADVVWAESLDQLKTT